MPPLTDHGPQPGVSCLSRRGTAVSWCHTTSQLVPRDLSKSVARNGSAPLPKTSFAIPRRRESRAALATTGFFRACRTPALLRLSPALARSSSNSEMSSSSMTPGMIANPRCSTDRCHIDAFLAEAVGCFFRQRANMRGRRWRGRLRRRRSRRICLSRRPATRRRGSGRAGYSAWWLSFLP